MPETPENNNPFEETLKNVARLRTTSKSFVESIADLRRANTEIKNSRRAALNVLEDSILSKAALAKSEERLQLVLKAAKIGTFVYYPNEDRGEPDAQMLALYGLPPDDTLNLARALSEIIHPEDRERYAHEVRQALEAAGNGKLDSDIRIIHPDGSVHWMNVNAQTIFENGQAVRMPGVSIDITERKEAEEALRDSEEAFRSYVTVSSDIVYKMSPDWQTMINLQGKNFLTSVTNPTASWIDIYIPEHERKKVQQAIDKAVAAKTMFELEHQVVNARGNLSWVYSRAVPRINEQEKIIEWIGAASDITERKQAEEALRTSEAQLRALIKSLPGCAVFVVNKDLRYILAEGEALQAAGFVPEDIVGKTVSEVVPENLRKHYISRYQKALTGIPFNEEHQAHTRTFISRGVPLTNIRNEIYAVLAISYDITERKKAEEALHTSEERLKVTMESAVDYAIITMNTERIIEQWNTGAERTFGFSAEEAKGKSADIIFTEEDRAANEPEREMQTAKKNGYAEDERWHQRKDGSKFYVSGVMRAICNPELIGYVRVARDMTEQQQAQEQLRIYAERYRIALQSAEMASWDWNIVEDTVVWNEQHYVLLGLTPDDRQKHALDFLKFVYEEDKERVNQALKIAIEASGVYQAEFRIKRADNGEIRWMNGFGLAVSEHNKRATRMVGVMFDITARKKLEQQKEDFIGIASHELKTPVTSIKAYTELLEDVCADGDFETGKPLMKKLGAQVDRLIELIHALLDVSKIAEGELPLHYETFKLNTLLQERAEDLQRTSNIHRIIFQSKKEIVAYADRERIVQVFTNLISNAIKYSPKGGNITIQCRQTKEEIEVSVQDEGIGISKEAQEKVFDRFFRVKNAQQQTFPGMGLGLYITANIIHRHGGKIRVTSEPGRGSTFYFTIPKHKNNNDENNNNDR